MYSIKLRIIAAWLSPGFSTRLRTGIAIIHDCSCQCCYVDSYKTKIAVASGEGQLHGIL